MPRIKSEFPNFKAFGFSIVIHNVVSQAKEIMERFVSDQSPDWSVIALEPYNHQEGHHLHIFIKWKSQHRSVKWFNFHRDARHLLIAPKPPDVEGEWGRIELDRLKGDKEYCLKYLVNPKKDKLLDPDVKLVDHTRLDLIDKWAAAAARLNRKFLFPETHGEELITCIEYCKYLESRNLPIPEFYRIDWVCFNKPLPPREVA